jgi:integrase
MFEAEQIRKMLDAANVHLKALILLAINCGFGQSDIASLPLKSLDLENGWVTFPRPKTEVYRRCPLWPETVDAIKASLAKRYEPKSTEDKDLVFISKQGHRLVRYQDGSQVDGIGQVFAKLVRKLGFKRQSVSFYSLRRTFRTIADEVPDPGAIRLIMGHEDRDMGALYTQRISDERLLGVTDHVRKWLWPTSRENA